MPIANAMPIAAYRDTASEADLLAAVLELAEREGWLATHFYDSRQSTGAGWPDVVLVKRGRLIIAELKSATGRVSAAQAKWLDELLMVGRPEVKLWRPNSWREIEASLRR